MSYPAAFADNRGAFPVNWQALLSERTEDVAPNVLAYNGGATPAPAPVPELCAPIQPLSSLLVEFLSRPGMEEVVEKYWKTRPKSPAGQRSDIMDGDLWKSLEGPDGKLFFDAEGDKSGELRIGVTLGIDW